MAPRAVYKQFENEPVDGNEQEQQRQQQEEQQQQAARMVQQVVNTLDVLETAQHVHAHLQRQRAHERVQLERRVIAFSNTKYLPGLIKTKVREKRVALGYLVGSIIGIIIAIVGWVAPDHNVLMIVGLIESGLCILCALIYSVSLCILGRKIQKICDERRRAELPVGDMIRFLYDCNIIVII